MMWIDSYWFLNPYTEGESEPTLLDAFPDWDDDGGIFYYLSQISAITLPWSDDESVTPSLLDLEYYGNRSGAKFCSPLVKLLLNDDLELESISIAKIANVIAMKYHTAWSRLWNTYDTEYSPLSNYDITTSETRLKDTSESELSDTDETHTGTDGLSESGTNSSSVSQTDNGSRGIYGLNSSSSVPSDTDSETSTTSESGSDSKSSSRTKNLADTNDTRRDKVGAETESVQLTKQGNIGTTSYQSLINAEREVWRWNFFEQVFRDVDKELTLAISDPCRV